MNALLAGRAILVTGAGRGLGRAYAEHAAISGAHVLINDVDTELAAATAAAITEIGGAASVVDGSVASWEGGARVIERAAATTGGLHGVVTNAGVFDVGDPWDADGASLDAMLAVNVIGTIAVGVAAMKILPRGGSIVTVTSGAAGGMSGMSLYGATKGAVLAASASWAIDLAPRGVRVNCVSPIAETKLTEIGRTRLGPTPPQPSPGTVAPVVSYLLSSSSEPLTGLVLRVEGDELSLMSHLTKVRTRHRSRPGDVGDVATCIGQLVAG